jgi:hypothetical protein
MTPYYIEHMREPSLGIERILEKNIDQKEKGEKEDTPPAPLDDPRVSPGQQEEYTKILVNAGRAIEHSQDLMKKHLPGKLEQYNIGDLVFIDKLEDNRTVPVKMNTQTQGPYQVVGYELNKVNV